MPQEHLFTRVRPVRTTAPETVTASTATARVLDQLSAFGVVPVIRTSTPALARTAIEWLREAGIGTFEITMTTPGAVSLITDIATAFPDLLIGAGTVTSAEAAQDVIAAGARYVVSPWVVPDVGAVCQHHNVTCLMGTLTPTEVAAALSAGATAIKIFPASSVGPGHLKALRSVFPGVPMMPTGGIDAKSIGDWIRAGAICVGAGGKLVDESLVRSGNRQAVTAAAEQILTACQQARDEMKLGG